MLSNPQPAALQNELVSAARESVTTMGRAIQALSSSGENASEDLATLARYRSRMLAYASEVSRARDVSQNWGRWFKSLVRRDGGCQRRSISG